MTCKALVQLDDDSQVHILHRRVANILKQLLTGEYNGVPITQLLEADGGAKLTFNCGPDVDDIDIEMLVKTRARSKV
jgi:hypothetical protein